jgi:eukaryotic-like serine/threonine-protein kinase
MPTTPTLVSGRYRLGPQLGRGGMGVVWEAYDELLHRTVAVKELSYPDGVDDAERAKLARRPLREARAVAAVEDPHAVRVFDIVEQDGRPWIVMELVRGRTLTEVIREHGALRPAEVVRIGLALCDALEAAHRAGVLHRDVKPSNVIVGDDGRIALTDFGIATVASDSSDVTTAGQIVGSPAYMAPERASGEVPTQAADLWSLGATLWTAAEGRPPYDGDNAFATMAKVVTQDPPGCERCEGPLGAVLGDLMARHPARRPTIPTLRQRLSALAGTPDVTTPYPGDPGAPQPLREQFDRTVALELPAAVPPSEPPAPLAEPVTAAPVPPARRRSRAPLLAVLALALLGAAVVGAFLLSRGGRPSTAATPPSTPSRAATTPSASASQPGSPAATTLPPGWRRYTDPAVGWSIGVPAGWQIQPQGSEVFLRDPAGGRYLQLDTKSPAGPSAKGAWEDQERSFRTSHSGYQRLRLESVSWRGYPDVADWEFTYTSGAAPLHAVDRGAVVAGRGYGLFFQTHADQWADSQSLLTQLYASFRPA